MTLKDNINNRYFDWMYNKVCSGKNTRDFSYKKLLMRLHTIEFRYYIAKDSGRASDGIDLRYRFSYEEAVDVDRAERYITGPCSVLEMMVALAIRCEETIMDNTIYGDRTAQWFWGMITNMGLGSMEDKRFDRKEVDEIVDRFLERRYERDGKGGLFRVTGTKEDLRDIEIWWQMCRFINSIT